MECTNRIQRILAHLNSAQQQQSGEQLKFQPTASSTTNATSYTIRRLQQQDLLSKNFLALLAQLTTVGKPNQEQIISQFQQICSNPNHIIFVATEANNEKIVATASLLIELKFVHECGKVGHIEDVVVDESCRGSNLGKLIIEACLEEAKRQGCYKVILDCSEKNVKFYEKCGFVKKEYQMRFDIH